jgi:hypothetical protein
MFDVFLIISHIYKPSGLSNSRKRHLQNITWPENANDAWCNLRPVMSKRLCLHVGIIISCESGYYNTKFVYSSHVIITAENTENRNR